MDAAIQSLTERGEYSTGWSKDKQNQSLGQKQKNGEKALQSF